MVLTTSAETRSITEPAGALALAGLKRHIVQNNLIGANKRFVAVVSGANMNFDRLRFVAERAELGEGREALLSAEIPEKAGRCVSYHCFVPQNTENALIASFHYTGSSILELLQSSSTATMTLSRRRYSYPSSLILSIEKRK